MKTSEEIRDLEAKAFEEGFNAGIHEEQQKYIEAMKTMSDHIKELEDKLKIKGVKELIENIVDKVNELSKTVIRLRDYDEVSNQIVQLSGDVIALQSWYAGTAEGENDRRIAEVIEDIMRRKDDPGCKEIRKNCVMIDFLVNQMQSKKPYYSILYYDKRDNTYYDGFGSYDHRIVNAYKEAYFEHWDKDFFEKKIEELGDKHWEECRQIALYDDQLRKAMKLLERIKDVHLAAIRNNDAAVSLLTGRLLHDIEKLEKEISDSERRIDNG